jgi:hypothetical protein
MFYKKGQSEKLNLELFKNPTKEYRGAPFWAWNTKLEKDILLEQIEVLKKMGFGGFFIHSRSGLNTEYLGKEFFEMVKSCRDKAECEDMLCYLYDEDKWPSGYGGGFVTKTPAYRQKMIYFSDTPHRDAHMEGNRLPLPLAQKPHLHRGNQHQVHCHPENSHSTPPFPLSFCGKSGKNMRFQWAFGWCIMEGKGGGTHGTGFLF